MSYHCERCGAHLDDLATQCGCDLPPTKAEIERARIGHATPIMNAVIAERDRLAADVDELQRRLVRVKAESLRVVVAKETCSLNECSERFYIQPTCCHDRQVTGKNIQADFRRHPDTTVLPVRLEPWEDE